MVAQLGDLVTDNLCAVAAKSWKFDSKFGLKFFGLRLGFKPFSRLNM